MCKINLSEITKTYLTFTLSIRNRTNHFINFNTIRTQLHHVRIIRRKILIRYIFTNSTFIKACGKLYFKTFINNLLRRRYWILPVIRLRLRRILPCSNMSIHVTENHMILGRRMLLCQR